MSELTVLVFIVAYSSAFLINDFDFNKTSSTLPGQHSSVEDSIRDLMALIVEEKRMRFQLETRLNDAEGKLNQMYLYNVAVSAELEKEKNKTGQLETRLKNAESKLNQIYLFNVTVCEELEKEKNKTEQLAKALDLFTANNGTTELPSTKTDTERDITLIHEEMANLNQTLLDKFIDIDKQLELMNQSLLSAKGESVGFSVYKPFGTASNYTNALRFQDVIYNGNNAYNITTGVFTCPNPGLYLFILTLVKTGDTDAKVFCRFTKNGQLIATSTTVFADGSTDKFSSGTNAVLYGLEEGDQVYISSCSYINHMAWETSFTGVRVSPNF